MRILRFIKFLCKKFEDVICEYLESVIDKLERYCRLGPYEEDYFDYEEYNKDDR